MIHSLDEFKNVAEVELPTVLAGPFHRCRNLPPDDVGGRLKCLLDLGELTTKFTCIVLLQELRVSFPEFISQLPNGKKSLDVLRIPSFGHWHGLIRELNRIDLGDRRSEWFEDIHRHWTQKDAHLKPIIRELAEQIGRPQMGAYPATAASLCETLVTTRNTNSHKSIRAESLLQPVEAGVSALISRLIPVFRNMAVFQLTEVRITEAKRETYDAFVTNLRGTTPEKNRKIKMEARLEIGDVYLTDLEKSRAPVTLTPFILHRVGDSGEAPESYVYNQAWSSRLVYESHATGRLYHHKELHQGFAALVSLDLKPGRELDKHRDMSAEDRSKAACEFLKRARLSWERDHPEDAILALEESACYEPRADTFYEMAKVNHSLNDSEAAMARLEACLDLDPNHAKARQFLQTLINEEANPSARPERRKDSETGAEFPTLYHVLTPRNWFNYSFFWCVGLLALWYLPSIAIEGLFVGSLSALAITALFFCCSLHVAGFVGTRTRLMRSRPALLLQLNEQDERFNRFFADSMLITFGRWQNPRRERYFYAGWILWGATLPTVFVVLTSLELPILLIIKRWADFAVLSVLMYYQARGIIGLTRFIWLYSQRSLKPFLSRVADGGLPAFGPTVSFPMLLLPFWWLAFWAALGYLIRVEHLIDLIMLVLGIAISMIWSLGLPIALYRSARASRFRVASDYSFHMQSAFAKFIKDPVEENLAKYEWLREQQKVIRKTPVWPLAWSETLVVVVFSNITLFTVGYFYAAGRLDVTGAELWRLLVGVA